MAPLATIFELMGDDKSSAQAPTSQVALVRLAREGVPLKNFVFTLNKLGLTDEMAATALRVPPRTLARRKKQQKLDPRESEKFLRLVRVAARAMEVLGSLDKAKRWLSTPNRALGGETPLSLLDTDIGALAVEDVLGRIEHGIYS